MADYEDHDLLVARHASSRKDRHRRRKYRRDRVRPEDRDDLVAGHEEVVVLVVGHGFGAGAAPLQLVMLPPARPPLCPLAVVRRCR